MPSTLRALLLFVLAAGCAGRGAPHLVPSQLDEPTLGAGGVADRLEAGERHRLRLDAGGGRWLTIELEQYDSDVALTLLDRDGEPLDRLPPPGNWSSDSLDLITGDDGPYVVEITSVDGDVDRGAYRLRLREDRPARPDDPARQEARRRLRALERPDREPAPPSPEESEALLVRLLESPEVAWSEEEEAWILELHGDLLLGAGRFAEAEDVYRDGLARLAGLGPRPVAVGLEIGLARALARQGDFTESRRHFRQAVDVAAAAADGGAYGMAVNYEALFLFERGEGEAASRRLREALASGLLADNAPARVSAHLNLALFLRGLGDLETALAHYAEAARLSREASVGSPASRFHLLRSGALLQRAAGEVEDALATFDEALDLAVAEEQATWEMSIRIHLGSLLSLLGESRDARRHLEESARLAASAGNTDYRARTLLSLAWIEINEAEPAAAIARLEQGLATAGTSGELAAASRFALAVAKMRLGDAAGARDLLTALVDRAEQQELPLAAADAHRALGTLHLEEGSLEQAASSLSRAMTLAETLGDPIRQAAARSLLARLDVARDEPRAALAHLLAAIALRETVRSQLVDPELRSSFLARWRVDFDLGIELAMGLAADEPEAGFDLQAFSLSEGAHARTLTELLAEARVDVRRGISTELLTAEREAHRRLSRLQAQLTELGRQAAPASQLAPLREAWEAAGAQRREVEREIRRRHPRYAEIHYPRPPDVAQVQAWLPAGTGLLEYSLGERSSTLFVITREHFRAVSLPPGEQIADLVGSVRRDILGRSRLAGNRLAARLGELGNLLIAPAADLLAEVDHLLVVPDRDLFHLPFEALVDPAAPELGPGGLLRRWTISYLPAAAALPHLGQESQPRWEIDLLAFADPPPAAGPVGEAPDGAPGRAGSEPRLPSLPGARREAEQIAALFPSHRVQLFVGEEARESLLKTPGATAPARRLHIASHGVISVTDADRSYVLLAPDPPEDGRLHLHEIFNLDLAAELVVLSGCETGLGPRLEGEGLIGLARGFLYAGARDLLVSLWPVSDEATVALMVDFYRQLIAGQSPAEALRTARLARLDDPGTTLFAWAPFIVYGAPTPPRPVTR